MKEKIKKFFSKDNLFILICTLLIGLFVLLGVLFYKKDINNVNVNKQSNINIVDDENNLNTSWSIDSNGNLVGNNILNNSIVSVSNGSFNQNNSSFIKTGSGNTLADLYIFRDSEVVDIYRGINGIQQFTISYPTSELNTLSLSIIGNSTDSAITINFQLLQSGIYTISGYFNPNEFNNASLTYLMLNVGSIALSWEPYGVWYSEYNYDNVNEQLQLQTDVNKYGWLSYIDNVELNVNNTNVREFTFQELKSENYIGADGSFNLLTLSMYNNPNYNNVSIDIYFANSIINSDTLPINLFNVSTKEGFNGSITIRDSESQIVVLNVQDVNTITYENILNANSDFNNEIYNVEFNFVSPDSATLIFANSNYSLGFQSGFNKGYNVSNSSLISTINNLNSQVSSLTNDYDTLNNNYNSLNTNYQNLLIQYNDLANNEYTFSELFWSISSVPFGVLASGFNVNVLGVNLAAIITGLFTALLIIWIIKKFLK